MTEIISAMGGPGWTSPVLVLGYEADKESRNLVHPLVGGGIAITVLTPNPRSGTLTLFYTTEEEAFAALALHSDALLFSLTSDDRPHLNMVYGLSEGGTLTIALDEDTRELWTVAVPFQEVPM